MKPMSGASSAPSGPLPDSLSSLFMSPVAVSKLNEIFQNAPSPSAPQKSATSSRGVSGSSVGPTETKELDRVEDIFRELLNQRFQVWRQQCVPFLGLLISTTRRRSTTSTVDMNGELGAGNCVPGSPRSDGPSSSPGVIDSSYFISAPSSSLLSPYLSPSLPAFTTMTSALLQGIDEKLFPFFFEFSMQVANGALAPSKAVDFLSRRLLPLTLFHFLLIATDLRRSEVLAVSASPSGVESPNSSHSTRTAGSSSERSSTDAGEDTSSAGQDASCLELLTIDASLRNCFRSLPCSEKTINSEAAVDFIFSTFAPKKNGLERESDVEGSGGGGGAAAAGTGGGVGGFLPVCSRSCFLPLPFRSMLLDAITVVSEMCVHVDPSRTEYKQMKNNLGGLFLLPLLLCSHGLCSCARPGTITTLFFVVFPAFFRLLEMERLVTPADICAFGSSLRLDDIGWPRLVSSTSGSGGGGSGARKRVHELLIKERTKRKFTLTVYNLCREHIGMYARLHATLLAYVENNEVHIPVQACLQAIASIVGEGSLCPSRTLAIILSVYQDHLFSQNQLLPLVCLFSREKLLEVIIFQLHLYAELRKQRDAAEEEAALTIKLEPLAHAPSSPRNRSGEKTSSGPASVGGGSTSSTSSQPAATDTSLASATASVSSAEETMGIFAQQAHKAGVGGPSMNFYRMLALFIMRDMLSLNDVYPHLQPADALLAVLFERTANRYRAALTGVKSGSFPAPPKPHLTPEQHMRALLPSLMAPLTNAGRSGEGGGGPSTGVPGVGSSLGARHTGPGQPALGPGGAPVSAPPIQHGAPPSYGGLGRPLHGSGWPSSGTPYNSGVPTNAPPPHQLYGNYHVPPSGLPGGGTGMGGGGVQGSYYGSHAAGAVGGQPGSPKDREREAREKERADREAREKVEKERKQLEKDLISKEQELRSKDAGNPLLDLPGGREYLLYDEQGYRYARDKVYAMEIGKFQLLAAFLDLNGMIYAHQLMLHMMTNLSVSPAANAVVQRSLGKLIRWLVTPLLSSRPTDCLEAYLQQRKKLRPQPPVSTPPRTPASRATSGRDSFSHPGVTECQIPQSPPSSLARLIRTVNDAERFDPSPCQHASHWLGAALYWKNGGKKGQPDDTNEAHSPVKREREGDCSSPSSSLVKRVKVEESAKSPTSSPTTGETETSKWNEVPLGKQEPREDADTLPSGGRRDSGGEVKKDEMFVGLRPVRTYEDFFKHVVPLLRYLGASLAYEGETFTAILAVLRGCAEKEEEQRRSAAGAATQKDKGVPLRSQLDSMIVELIFPALSLLPYGSSAVSCKLWRLLEVLPASRRYPIYEKVIEHWTTERSHPMALNYEVVRLKLRKVLKRLTSTICEKRVKQKEKHLLGEIAAVSCIAPFPLAELCISQADLFDDNMIQTLTEATRAVCPLAADVFVSRFVQRQQLREGDDGRSSPSGTSGAGGAGQPGASYGAPKKLLNRALMTGKFLTIHYGTELLPLLVSTILRLWKDFSPAEEYISEPIKNQKALRLVGENKRYPNDLLGYYRDKEFIERLLEIMGGCPKLPEAGALTADQIYAQVRIQFLLLLTCATVIEVMAIGGILDSFRSGGGPLLKIEVMAVDEDDSSNNGVVDTTKGVHGALLRALGRPEIFIPLLFILAKQ
ncbi:transcription factor nuclear export subunit 2, partial [Cystoisospora suis]